jgi:predicted nucleic acid-binding protein
VMVEIVTLVRRRLGLDTAISLAKTMAKSEEVRILWVERVHHDQALQVMVEMPGKNWSMTDCTSFIVMRALKFFTAFSFDADFLQAGFSVLP